jgi:hypothetical protein
MMGIGWSVPGKNKNLTTEQWRSHLRFPAQNILFMCVCSVSMRACLYVLYLFIYVYVYVWFFLFFILLMFELIWTCILSPLSTGESRLTNRESYIHMVLKRAHQKQCVFRFYVPAIKRNNLLMLYGK